MKLKRTEQEIKSYTTGWDNSLEVLIKGLSGFPAAGIHHMSIDEAIEVVRTGIGMAAKMVDEIQKEDDEA